MKYATAALALAASAYGAGLIPDGVSAGCSTFLTALNADASITKCIEPLAAATANFAPGAQSAATEDTLNVALAKLCTGADTCDEGAIRSQLNGFYQACSADMQSATLPKSTSKALIELYDMLYVFVPLRSAVCSVDPADQAYCVKTIGKSTAAGAKKEANSSYFNAVTEAAASLLSSATSFTRRWIRVEERQAKGDSFASVAAPLTSAFQSTNLPFLFLQGDMTSDALCTRCTRQVFVSYMKWENEIPYGIGLSNSPTLGGQAALWKSVGSTCGESFTAAVLSEAGANSAKSGSVRAAAPTAAAIIAGAVAFALAA